MPPSRLRPLIAATAATAIVVSVAACGSDDASESAADQSAATTATTTPDETTSGTTESGDATTATDDGSDGTSTAAGYRDGEYSAEGSYQSPGGSESVAVSLTLQDGTITQLTVTPEATHPNSKNFQGKFASGIDALVVGKPIDDLQVDKVSGSSLTSGGFNAAIETIKGEATA